MVFSDEDKILIKSLHSKGYTAKRLTGEFPEKSWTKRAANKLLNNSSAVAEMGDRLATIDMGRKVWKGCCGGWVPTGSPFNTMWPGPRPASLPSGISIHPTVWPQL